MSDEKLTIATVGAWGIHYAKCWPCLTNACPGGIHDWADAEDIDHAAKTGQANPAGIRCGCLCAAGPVLDRSDDEDFDRFDGDGIAPPCPVCGEAGACGYDSEGRPMIHSDMTEDES